MNIVRRLLIKGLAGVVIIAGGGSLITLAIMTGVEVAYAASSHNVMANEEPSHYTFVLKNGEGQKSRQGGLDYIAGDVVSITSTA